MSLLHWAVLSPFIMAVLTPIFYKLFRRIHTGWFVFILPVLLFAYFLFIVLGRPGTAHFQSAPWIPSLGLRFDVYADGLSLLFALLITGIGSLVVLYSIYYLSKRQEPLHNFYVYLLLFMGAMLGVVLSDNLIVLYTFWELTSLSSFLLIGFWHHREKSRNGAQKSLLITVLGGLAMLGGFVLLSYIGQTLSIRELIVQSHALFNEPLFIPAMLLILLGAFTKSAQFPFYIWLPDAMEAPTPVSAYLHSATMVKAGIYLVARLTPIFAISSSWLWLTAGAGILTLLWGSLFAAKQTDLKGILAYSTVSQLGLIMSLLGIGSAAVHYRGLNPDLYLAATTAAVFHIINHATFKGSLFMAAGIIDHETGTRDIRKLGGLIKVMPATFTITAIGTLSMAGIPPFNGFISKEMFLESMVQIIHLDLFHLNTWGILFPVIAWTASVFTFLYSMIVLFKPFTGKLQTGQLPKKPHEAPIGMLIPPMISAGLVILFGLFPNLLSNILIRPAAASIQPSLIHENYEIHLGLWHGFTPALWMTLGIITAGTLLYLTLKKWQGLYHLVPEKWSLNHAYTLLLKGIDKGALKLTNIFMTGNIRTWLLYIFVFFSAALLYTLFAKDAFQVNLADAAPVNIYEGILAAVLIIASLAILFAKSRLSSIILLGASGYIVSLFFVLFRAPDLALTQLIIETISVALFLLCFYRLPKWKDRKKEERIAFKWSNALVAAAVGLTVTLVALSAQSTKPFTSISSYYKEHAYSEAGGKNIVNVILVDFRGLDTMFEITVLGIAALGIYGMIKLQLERRKQK